MHLWCDKRISVEHILLKRKRKSKGKKYTFEEQFLTENIWRICQRSLKSCLCEIRFLDFNQFVSEMKKNFVTVSLRIYGMYNYFTHYKNR